MPDLDFIRPPSPLLVEPVVRAALVGRSGPGRRHHQRVDHCRGRSGTARLMARKPGVLAGLNAAEIAFRLVDPSLKVDIAIADGGGLAAGDLIASISRLRCARC